MADLAPYMIALGDRNYPATYTAFLNYLDPFLDEIEVARNGEASVLARIQKCVVSSVGFTQDTNANGFRITNLPVPVSANEPATKAFAESLAFAAALPAQTDNAGLSVVTDGAAARWGISNAEAMAILNFINF